MLHGYSLAYGRMFKVSAYRAVSHKTYETIRYTAYYALPMNHREWKLPHRFAILRRP